MLKPQMEKKARVVEDLKARAARAKIGILADFTGLPVAPLTSLRHQLKEAGGELKVVKNTLFRRAAADSPLLTTLAQALQGPNALILGYDDPVNLAKLLVKFAQDAPLFRIKMGALGTQVLSPQEVEALSKLPPREVLLAQLLGVLKGVPQGLVLVLSGVIRNLLNVLVAIRDKKAAQEQAGETPAS